MISEEHCLRVKNLFNKKSKLLQNNPENFQFPKEDYIFVE